MKRIARALPMVIVLVLAGCRGGEEEVMPKFSRGNRLAPRHIPPGRDAPAAPPKSEWKLPSHLALSDRSLDVSPDRRLAVVWGERGLDTRTRKSCWVLDLQTGKIEDLSDGADEAVAAIIHDTQRASFSPDATRLLISAEGGESACVVELSRGEVTLITKPYGVLWVGDRLLFSRSDGKSAICSVAGEIQERPNLRGCVIASDPSGTKLLLQFPNAAVVSSKGEVLRKFGPACDRDLPLLSRSGNWAGVFCAEEDGWGYSLVSTTTDEKLRLARPWGATLALTDDGDSILPFGGEDNGFLGLMTGGRPDGPTTTGILFWPKDDEPLNSKEQDSREERSRDKPPGKSQVIADKATAFTVLGKELFFVQAEGDERTLRAVPLPQPGASSPATKPPTAREKR
jgi:hypothetical protein